MLAQDTDTVLLRWTLTVFLLLGLISCGSDSDVASEASNLGAQTAAASFVSTWRTTSTNETITLPLRSGYNYNFTVNWGDGEAVDTITAYNDANITHTYSDAGDHTVTIDGLVEAWYFANGGDKDKIINVVDLGDVGWINLSNSFRGCSNLESFSGGETANVTNMSWMFYESSSLTSLDLSSFNTAGVTNMSYMFSGTSTLRSLDLSSFNTNSVTTMRFMFLNATSLRSLDLNNFNTVSVTDMLAMFNNTTSLISLNLTNWDTSHNPSSSLIFNGSTATIYCVDPDKNGANTVLGYNCN